jgi:hypothetical protein
MKTNQETSSGRMSMMLINSLLVIGIVTLIFTLFYLLFHLDESDKIINRCIPAFVFGLTSVVCFGWLNRKNLH